MVHRDDAARTGGFGHELLRARGYNTPFVEAPFLIEEYVEHCLSPTADAHVDQNGELTFVRIGLQRLYDGRYYAGFHSHAAMADCAWYQQVQWCITVVGDRLRSIGYQGFFNLDFVVDDRDRAYLIELNPRRSALQDGYGLADALHRAGRAVTSISTADYVECRRTGEIDRSEGNVQMTVVRATDAALHSEYRWVSLCALEPDGRSEAALAAAIGQLTGIAGDPASLAEEIGPTPLSWKVHDELRDHLRRRSVNPPGRL
jgi:hypothetical protein